MTTSATLVTLSLALCLGAGEVSGVSSLRPASAGEQTELTPRQRRTLASLLSQLTDAARTLQRTPHHAAVTLPPRRARFMPRRPSEAARPIDRPWGLPTPPLRPALRNLPPPRA